MNLVTNTIKFTKTGTITIKARVLSGDITLSVQDTGIGFNQKIFPLFRPFHQIDSGIKRKNEGTGLDLSIGKKIVELPGSKNTVASTLRFGSMFIITLPVMGEVNYGI